MLEYTHVVRGTSLQWEIKHNTLLGILEHFSFGFITIIIWFVTTVMKSRSEDVEQTSLKREIVHTEGNLYCI